MRTARRKWLVSTGFNSWLACLMLLLAVAGRADEKDRFSLNTHIGFNIKADFTGLGGFPAQTDPGPPTGGANHTYDDGYNRVDASGNANGSTWYWGYQNSSQLGNDSIVMSSSSSAGTAQLNDVSDDPQWGAELTYAHEFGSNSSYWWGVVVGLGWVNLNIKDSATFSSDVQQLTDTYSLGGIVPPIAPYSGSYSGPGSLIGDAPVRSVQTLPGAALTSGQYSIDANLYTLRLGLLYESPFNDWLALQFGGGALGGVIDSEFRFSEQVSLGVGGLSRQGATSDTGLVGGAYGEAGFILYLGEHWTATAGIQYQYLSDFSQKTDGKEATVKLKNSLYLCVGVGARF
jgi:hypothetical protein